MLMYRAAGPAGALGCGLALLCLGLFLLTPVAVLLLKGDRVDAGVAGDGVGRMGVVAAVRRAG